MPIKNVALMEQKDKSVHFGSFWPVFGPARTFSKNLAPSLLSTYGPSISCKIWNKSNKANPEKKCCYNGWTDKSYHFGPFWPISTQAHPFFFFKKISSASFEYWCSLNLVQNIKKTNTLILKKAVLTNQHTNWTVLGFFWPMFGQARNFLKNLVSSILSTSGPSIS